MRSIPRTSRTSRCDRTISPTVTSGKSGPYILPVLGVVADSCWNSCRDSVFRNHWNGPRSTALSRRPLLREDNPSEFRPRLPAHCCGSQRREELTEAFAGRSQRYRNNGRSDGPNDDRRLAAGSVSSRALSGGTIRRRGIPTEFQRPEPENEPEAARDHSPRQGDQHDGSQHMRC